MPFLSNTLVLMLGKSLANACARVPRYVGVHTLGGRLARSRDSASPLPTAAPMRRPSAAAFSPRASATPTPTLDKRGALGLALVLRSGILYDCAQKISATARARYCTSSSATTSSARYTIASLTPVLASAWAADAKALRYC